MDTTGSVRTLPSVLLPGAQDDGEAESIKSVLGRIFDERGAFRHITEQSLEAELVNECLQGSSSDSEDDEDEIVEVDELESKPRAEQLFAKKAEMLSHLMPAQNEILILLDVVSLVASKDVPKQAEMTMSPALKQQLKPGTLAFDMWNNMPLDREQQDTDDAISRSWKMQSLQASADSLLSAAARLEKDVRRETRYWDQVLSVSERGWSLCRMPREKHNLGVRFGFLEATGEYRDRGLAALRTDELGNVVLDKGLSSNSKCIRVRTLRGSTVIGTSRTPRAPQEPDTTLEARIRAARDSLYEEELFHEITRESRTLASYGIDMIKSTISLPTRLDSRDALPSQSTFDKVLIELISPDEISDEEVAESSEDVWPHAIAVAFRILLSYTHRGRLKGRSDLPPPMSLARKDSPISQILRPILTILHHHSVSTYIDRYLNHLASLLATASIEASVQPAKFDASVLQQAETMDSLMGGIMAPLRSQGSLSLMVPGTSKTLDFTIDLYSSCTAPILGSKIVLKSPVRSSEIELDDTEELVECVDEAIAKALTLEISDKLPGWKYNSRLGLVSKAGKQGKVSVEVESDMLEGAAGHLTLNTDSIVASWGPESMGGNSKRQFWDLVGDIK